MRNVRWWFVGLIAMTLASPASAQVASFSTLGLPSLFGQEAPPSPLDAKWRLFFGTVFNPAIYDSNPEVRMQRLLEESETLRQVRGEWRRFWMNDKSCEQVAQQVEAPATPCCEIELTVGGCYGEKMVFFVEDCLKVFSQLWARGDCREAERFAEKAAQLDPTNVKARHALVVAQIVNARSAVAMPSRIEELLKKEISLHYQSVPIRTAYEDLSRMTGLNIICDKEAFEAFNGSGVLTLRAGQYSVQGMLDALTNIQKLKWIVNNETVIIVKPGMFRVCGGVAVGDQLDCLCASGVSNGVSTCEFACDKATGSCAKGCGTAAPTGCTQLLAAFGLDCEVCCGSKAKAGAAPAAKKCACAAPPACCCATPAAAKGCACCTKACACAAPAVKACACAAPANNACACCGTTCTCAKSAAKACACCTKTCACEAPAACCCGKAAPAKCACCTRDCGCAKKCTCAEMVGCCPPVTQVPNVSRQGFVIVTVPGSSVVQNSAVPVATPTVVPNVMVPRPMAIPVSRAEEQAPARVGQIFISGSDLLHRLGRPVGYNVGASVKRVRLETPQFDAHCNKMTCVGGGDVVLLEGDVEMICRRQGAAMRVTGQRVRVYLNDGTFTVETASENTTVPAMVPSRPVHRIVIPSAVLPTDEDVNVLPR